MVRVFYAARACSCCSFIIVSLSLVLTFIYSIFFTNGRSFISIYHMPVMYACFSLVNSGLVRCVVLL